MVPLIRYCKFRHSNLCLLRHKTTSNNSNEKSNENMVVAKKTVCEYPEAPTTCCMSGCANCVWLAYTEKLTEYYKDGGEQALREINERITDGNIKAFLLHELRMRKILTTTTTNK